MRTSIVCSELYFRIFVNIYALNKCAINDYRRFYLELCFINFSCLLKVAFFKERGNYLQTLTQEILFRTLLTCSLFEPI